MEKATFAGGCFWCTEAIFKRVEGVIEVVSGYTGGKRPNPNYEQVSTGVSGHAEAINMSFDPSVISYEKLLELFWNLHDPTTPNQQGNDIGTQYRSAIFYHSAEQNKIAHDMKDKLEKDHIFERPIVTQILPFETFYRAEDYHQNYYDNNTENSYCNYVITPKVKKLLEKYSNVVKEEYK